MSKILHIDTDLQLAKKYSNRQDVVNLMEQLSSIKIITIFTIINIYQNASN